MGFREWVSESGFQRVGFREWVSESGFQRVGSKLNAQGNWQGGRPILVVV